MKEYSKIKEGGRESRHINKSVQPHLKSLIYWFYKSNNFFGPLIGL